MRREDAKEHVKLKWQMCSTFESCRCMSDVWIRICHAQTNTLLIFVAIACNFHEAPLLPFFLYRSTPKFPPLYLT